MRTIAVMNIKRSTDFEVVPAGEIQALKDRIKILEVIVEDLMRRPFIRQEPHAYGADEFLPKLPTNVC